MPHPERSDEPGAIHHVMNRALGRRTLFESRRDMRDFLALVARSVRRGAFELHAYALLTTHFHLVVRTRAEPLARALAWIERAYARAFNRRRDRDGPLFRGRFRSHRVDHERYLRAALLYVERNAVDAGIVASPLDDAWNSAHARQRRRPPRWLARTPDIDHLSQLQAGQARDSDWWIERRLGLARSGHAGDPAEPLEPPVGAPAAWVLDWMRRRTAIADGSLPGATIAAPGGVDRALAESMEASAARGHDPALPAPSAAALHAGLLRTLCGLSYGEIAARLGTSRSTAANVALRHRALLLADRGYAERAGVVAQRAIEATFGGDDAAAAPAPERGGPAVRVVDRSRNREVRLVD